jgi:hypothetical protein
VKKRNRNKMSKNKYKKLHRTLILKLIVLNVFTLNTIWCQDLVNDDSEVLDNRLNIIDHKISDDHFNHYDNAVSQFTELAGGSVVGERLLKASESPYLLRTDLEVERQAKLSVEAGVTIHFAPMVGITIRGTISAIVSKLEIYDKSDSRVNDPANLLFGFLSTLSFRIGSQASHHKQFIVHCSFLL